MKNKFNLKKLILCSTLLIPLLSSCQGTGVTGGSNSSGTDLPTQELGKCQDLYDQVTGSSTQSTQNLIKKEIQPESYAYSDLKGRVPSDYNIFTTENVASFNVGNYYDQFNFTLEGDNLINQVYLASKKNQKSSTYQGLASTLPYIDGDPRVGKENNVILFYTGESRQFPGNFSGTINREHVWPNSRGSGKSGPGADPHMLKCADVAGNGERGNNVYGQGKSGAYDPGQAGNLEIYRGIAARIVFYMALRYGSIAGDPTGLYLDESTSNSGKNMGLLTDLLKWNLKYPISYIEMYKNDAAQVVAGNRNPFIDYRSLPCKIWGDTNATTKQICANNVDDSTNYPDNPDWTGGSGGGSTDPEEPTDPSNPEVPSDVTISFNEYDKNKTVAVDKTLEIPHVNVNPDTYNPNLIYFSAGKYTSVNSENKTITGKTEGSEKIYVCDPASGANDNLEVKVIGNGSSGGGEGEVGTELAVSPTLLGVTDSGFTGQADLNGITFDLQNIRNLNDKDVWFMPTNAYVTNTTAFSKEISKVEFVLTPEGSTKAEYSVSFSDTPISSVLSDAQVGTSSEAGATITLTAPAGSKYFRIDSTAAKNLQIDSLVIYFK